MSFARVEVASRFCQYRDPVYRQAVHHDDYGEIVVLHPRTGAKPPRGMFEVFGGVNADPIFLDKKVMGISTAVPIPFPTSAHLLRHARYIPLPPLIMPPDDSRLVDVLFCVIDRDPCLESTTLGSKAHRVARGRESVLIEGLGSEWSRGLLESVGGVEVVPSLR